MIKKLSIIMMATMAVACGGGAEKPVADNRYALTPAEKEAGILTPEVMWKMGRIGGETLSPDGKTILYGVTHYSLSENKSNTDIYSLPFAGGEPVRIIDNGSSPAWSADGKTIYFLSSRSGEMQLWQASADGRTQSQVTSVEGGIEAFGVAPSGDKLFYINPVAVEKRLSKEIYEDMPSSAARIYDDLMVRHWDYWDEGSYRHIFIAPLKDGKAGAGKDIMEGEPWDAPTAPYFDAAEISWNNAGTVLAYTCKRQTGTEYAISTDSDIFLYDTATGKTTNICKKDGDGAEVMPGYDKYPVFSPDDTKVAFRSMRRAGNESDKERLFVWNSADGSLTDLTPDFDYSATNVLWNGNGSIRFIAPMNATHQVCEVSAAGGPVKVITSGDHDINTMTASGDNIVVGMTKISHATELFSVAADGTLSQLTSVNGEIYDNIRMGEVQKRWVPTTDGKEMLTWVILPPDFDPNKKYPTLLFCEGGPQSVVSQFWSYRWNFQLMAAQGYIVVAPNRRGVPSFGTEWVDQISGDYSGQNIKDYFSAIDHVAAEPWSDEERLGAVGASYGGYSVYFLAGQHEGRFKAFISHCGIFDFDSMYGQTEELWFVNRDYGGAYWDKSNAVAQRSYANSPHKFAEKWDTPILIFTGEKDYRIPFTQSLEAFTAARVQGIPSRLVVFENEAHQVFQPQNNVVWNREFFGWLDKYLKY